MKRQALVIGIYQYSALKDKPGSKAQHLKSAPDDAEAVARLLETYGDFEVHRLPCQEGARQIERKGAVYSKELREAIIRLFLPRTNNTPETAVLFFAGHGRQVEQDGNTEGFLVTSDCNPRKEQWGVSLRWLRKVLQKSRVRQQIVWLDCCNSGELFNFEEADIGTVKGRDRCFVAAAREFQTAFGQQSGEHGELTAALLEGLDPTKSSDGWVSNYTLIDSIEQTLKNAPQHPVLSNTGGEILLAGKEGVRGNICPYKGLNYFDFNEEDPKYFYGREALTTQLLMRAQKSNFIAVMGASGSGKSSVVRAGLLHELRQGMLSGSDRWKIYDPFTPGEDPLASLEQVLGVNASQSGAFIKAAAAERVVLVVDQFEEAFTLCRDVGKRERFFQCLMSLVGSQSTGGDRSKVLLVVVMRADFFGKCAERAYAGIAKKIEQNLMTVLPMSEEELRDAIVKPAEQVGLEIDRELVSQMIADVLGSPGNLPLMQYALTDLWEHRKLNRLTISDYTRLGGVRKALEKHADLVFQSLSETEQGIARRIFLELTHVGERSEDTRKQMRLQDLVNSQQSLVQVEEVLASLVNAKLLVTEEQELKEGEKVPVVNIAHEALIRNWGLLSNLLKENRDVLVRKQEIEDDAKAWRDNRKQGESAYFLQGTRLAAAEDYLQRYADRVPLSGLAQEFVGKSAKHRRNSNLRTAGIVTAVILGLTGLTGWALIEGEDARIRADSSSSESLFASDRKLEALVAGVRAAKRLRMPLGAMGAKYDTRILAVTALRRAVYGIRELNRFEGHVGRVSDVSISPDGQLIASVGNEDGTVKIWDAEGQLIATWPKEKPFWRVINRVSFSPDGQIIAFDNQQNIQLIDRNGEPLKNLEYDGVISSEAERGIFAVSFSPDGQYIAAGGGDREVRIKTIDGDLIALLAQDGWITDVTFMHNSQIIASNSFNRLIRVLNFTGQLVNELQHPHQETIDVNPNGVASIAVSQNQKIIASAGHNGLIALWKSDGNLLKTFKAHDDRVNSVTFSLDGETIVTGSNDGTIKLWKIDGTPIATITGHTGGVASVNFASGGQKIVTSSDDGTVRIWQLDTIPISTLRGHSSSVTDVEFSSDGSIIATASEDRTIKLWSQDGVLLNTLIGHSGAINNVSFSLDGERLVSSSAGQSRIWKKDGNLHEIVSEDLGRVRVFPRAKVIAFSKRSDILFFSHEGKLLSEIKTPNGRALGHLSLSPDARIIAAFLWSSGKRHLTEPPTLKLFKMNGQFITNLTGDIANFSNDGKLIATGGKYGVVRLFDYEGNLVKTLTGHSKNITDVHFSPDSQTIASASEDKTVKIWSRDGTLIDTLEHSDVVNSLSFSPDGKILSAAVDDGTVILWNFDLDDLLAKGCTRVRGYLKNNINVAEADRNLCDGVPTAKENETSDNQATASPPAQQKLVSEVGADYSFLRDLLKRQEFEAGDTETRYILWWTANGGQNELPWEKRYEANLRESSIARIPCTDLRIVNRLWGEASDGQFGFSIQKRLYEEVGKNYKQLYVKLGWGNWKQETFYGEPRTFNLSAVEGHLPYYQYLLRGFSDSDTETNWQAWMERLEECGL